MGVPLIIASHTVNAGCTVGIRETDGVTSSTITVPRGFYWLDPTYGTTDGGENVPCNLARVLRGLLLALDAAIDLDPSYGVATSIATLGNTPNLELINQAYGGPGAEFEFLPSTSSAEGKRLLGRFGLNTTIATEVSASVVIGPPAGIWWPGARAERNISHPGVPSIIGSVFTGGGGAAFPHTVGDPMVRRMLTLETVERDRVQDEYGRINSGVEDEASDVRDYTFRTLIWDWARRAELLRIYSDATAYRSCITTALDAETDTVDMTDTSGVGSGFVHWIDGEKVLVIGKTGTTLTIKRPNPVAHPAGAPISSAHVGTYALAPTGGNINQLVFNPARNSYNSPNYGMEIALIETSWED